MRVVTVERTKFRHLNHLSSVQLLLGIRMPRYFANPSIGASRPSPLSAKLSHPPNTASTPQRLSGSKNSIKMQSERVDALFQWDKLGFHLSLPNHFRVIIPANGQWLPQTMDNGHCTIGPGLTAHQQSPTHPSHIGKFIKTLLKQQS